MACEDIPSLLDLQKVKKHADDFCRLMGTGTGTSTNGVTGQVRPTFNKVINDMNTEFDAQIINMGFTVIGKFSTGATLTNPRQTLLWDIADGGDGQEYGWSGLFPKIVPALSDPNSTGGIAVGAWMSRFDPELRIQVREALRRSYAEIGKNLVPGSFESGASVTSSNDVVLYEANGKAYSFLGIPPVDAYLGSAPDAGWADESGKLLASAVPSSSPEMFNAIGDGAADDSAAVNQAITQSASTLHLRNGGKYLVPGLSNPLGRQVVGKGQLLKSATGGQEMLNSYVDAYQRITGQENLAAWFKASLQANRSPVIVLSGDSTTAGDGTTPLYKLDLLIKNGIRSRGLQTSYGTDVRNKGHSGDTAAQWASTYVTQDIADNPDLYIVRWGINDVKDVVSFAANLRAGLTTYRNAKPFAVSSILLMMPNSTYDIPNGRDAKWYEQLRDVYVQAARDFKCGFIDTYAITQNSKGLAGVLMDDPYGDGRGIHPNDMLNSIIAGYIVDFIAPFGAGIGYSVNEIMMTSGAESPETNTALLPIQYDGALNIIRVQPTFGWPLDGNAITFKTQDGTAIQYVFGYLDADRGKVFVRFGRAALGGQPEGWSEFMQMGVRLPSVAIVGNGTFQAGTSRCNKTGTIVVIDGKMITTPTNISAGVVLGNVPSGFRPTRDITYGVATVMDNSASSISLIPVNVQLNGDICAAGSASGISLIYLNISYDSVP